MKKIIIIFLFILVGIAVLFQIFKTPIMTVKITREMTQIAEEHLENHLKNNGELLGDASIEYKEAHFYDINQKVYMLNSIRIRYVIPHQSAKIVFTFGNDSYVVTFENDGNGNMNITECDKQDDFG